MAHIEAVQDEFDYKADNRPFYQLKHNNEMLVKIFLVVDS